MINYTLIFIYAALLSLILTPLLKIFAAKIKLTTSTGMPLSGGLGIWLSFFIVSTFSLLSCKCLSKEVWVVFGGSSLILVFGLIDDLRSLSVSLKFFTQCIAIALLILFGVKTQIVNIGIVFNLIITLLWVLGITNAFNHLDILDGLAGGIAIISSGAFFLLAVFSINPTAAILSLSLTAALLVFLVYNSPPAKVYMGNSGSHLLGFVLAAIAISISYSPLERKIALLSPIFILGLPIYDTALLILMRLKRGISPFNKSDDHLAHRLQVLGFSKRKILLLMYSFGALFCLTGIILTWVSNPVGITLITAVVVFCLFITKKMIKIPVDD